MSNITIENKQNAIINRKRRTLYDVRENGVYKGQFSIIGFDASDELCLSEYQNRFDYDCFFDYCSE
jgi:hypothetical protein